MALELKSSAFAPSAPIPKKYTCEGDDVSPPLSWSGSPSNAVSFALISDDPDAPAGTWVHWVMYNIPKSASSLSEGVSDKEILPDGARQGVNDAKGFGYGGPCPPHGGPHRYYFKLYALDAMLEIKGIATKEKLLMAMRGHILGEASTMGTYQR